MHAANRKSVLRPQLSGFGPGRRAVFWLQMDGTGCCLSGATTSPCTFMPVWSTLLRRPFPPALTPVADLVQNRPRRRLPFPTTMTDVSTHTTQHVPSAANVLLPCLRHLPVVVRACRRRRSREKPLYIDWYDAHAEDLASHLPICPGPFHPRKYLASGFSFHPVSTDPLSRDHQPSSSSPTHGTSTNATTTQPPRISPVSPIGARSWW